MLRRIAQLSLSSKLSLTGFALLGGAIAISGALTVASYTQDTKLQTLSDARARAALLAADVTPALLRRDTVQASRVLNALRYVPNVRLARLTDSSGGLVAEFHGAGWQDITLLSSGNDRDYFARRHLETVHVITTGKRPLGKLVLATDLTTMRYELVAFGVKVALLAAVALLLAFTALHLLQQAILKPFAALAAVLRRAVDEKRFELRVPTGPEDEVGVLATDVNALLERITMREAALRQEFAERTEAQRRIEELAHFDPLTKLPNRHYFLRQLERVLITAAQSGSAGAVLLIDLTGFRRVNEAFGHDAGDTLLLQFGRRVTAKLRDGDMLCRLGGDQFALVLQQVSGETHISAVANKILSAVQDPISIGEHATHVGACIGIAVFPVDGDEPHIVTRNAETALRRAKSKGQNGHCFFAPEMLEHLHPRFNIETELHRALAENELRLHFQPQVDLATGALRGMEVLVRWQHPKRGLLLPGEFIPMAEDNHALIRAVSDWTLGASCAQIATWQSAGLKPVTLAVNFTPVQLRDDGMPRRLDALLRQHDVPGSRVELEITENLLMAEPRAPEILAELRNRGLRIAVDDFGTGYSSLAYLKDLPITTLKIDRGFVHGVPDSAKYAGITRAIVGIARNLGFDTVAEGVETVRQADFLRALGCTAYQGFCFSPAVPAPEAERFLAEARAGRSLAVA